MASLRMEMRSRRSTDRDSASESVIRDEAVTLLAKLEEELPMVVVEQSILAPDEAEATVSAHVTAGQLAGVLGC